MSMKKQNIWKNKKLCGAVLSIGLVVATAVGVTAAYYRAETDEVVNQFSAGNVTTELVEDFVQNTDTEFTKTPRVTNTGANDCLIRLRMKVTPESLLNQKVLDEDGNATATDYLVISGWSSKWTLQADGFYYYSDIVKPGESTEPLFTAVTVNYDKNAQKGEPNEWVDFDIILYQEAVQAEVIKDGQPLVDLNGNGSNHDEIWASYAE